MLYKMALALQNGPGRQPLCERGCYAPDLISFLPVTGSCDSSRFSTFISYRVFSEKIHAMLLHEVLNNTVTPSGHRVSPLFLLAYMFLLSCLPIL